MSARRTDPKPRPIRKPRPHWLPSPQEARLERAIARACDDPLRLHKVSQQRIALRQHPPRAWRLAEARRRANSDFATLEGLARQRGESVPAGKREELLALAWNGLRLAAALVLCLLACGCRGGAGGELALAYRPHLDCLPIDPCPPYLAGSPIADGASSVPYVVAKPAPVSYPDPLDAIPIPESPPAPLSPPKPPGSEIVSEPALQTAGPTRTIDRGPSPQPRWEASGTSETWRSESDARHEDHP